MGGVARKLIRLCILLPEVLVQTLPSVLRPLELNNASARLKALFRAHLESTVARGDEPVQFRL